VCNGGPGGLEYHPTVFDSSDGKQKVALCFTLDDIPAERVRDASFWTVLYRMLIYPNKKHTAKMFYGTVLPSLNSLSVRAAFTKKDANLSYQVPPPAHDMAAYHDLALLGAATNAGPPEDFKSTPHGVLLIRAAALDMANRTLSRAPDHSMDPEDNRTVRLTARTFANYASTLDRDAKREGTTQDTLLSANLTV